MSGSLRSGARLSRQDGQFLCLDYHRCPGKRPQSHPAAHQRLRQRGPHRHPHPEERLRLYPEARVRQHAQGAQQRQMAEAPQNHRIQAQVTRRKCFDLIDITNMINIKSQKAKEEFYFQAQTPRRPKQ